MIDELRYCWPSAMLTQTRATEAGTRSQRAELAGRIESFFRQRWDAEVVVLPSARSALALILRHLGLNRYNRVFTSRWSSYCVWSCITPYCAPATTLTDDIDVVVLDHMYGYAERLSRPYGRFVVEDSCDTLIVDGRGLFPNGGQFEIVSLPKIMGTSMGGLLIPKDPSRVQELRERTLDLTDFNLYQAGLRREDPNALSSERKNLPTWWHMEHKNYALDLASLDHIVNNLSMLGKNAATIQGRLNRIRAQSPHLFELALRVDEHRLPCQLAIPMEYLQEADRSHFVVRHMDSNRLADAENYRTYGLLPLHFGFPEADFGSLMNEMAAALLHPLEG